MPFDPERYNWQSADGTVQALIGWPAPDELDISDFASNEKRKGHGRRALQELRPQYRVIRALCVDLPGTEGRRFWLAMAKVGLVNELYDFETGRIWPSHQDGAGMGRVETRKHPSLACLVRGDRVKLPRYSHMSGCRHSNVGGTI
jgi:hypothetical protein